VSFYYQNLVADSKDGEVQVARNLLKQAALYGKCIGGDVALRLIELHGPDYYITIATQAEWLIDVQKLYDNDPKNGEYFNISYTPVSWGRNK